MLDSILKTKKLMESSHMHDSDMNDHVIDHDFRNRFVCSWLFNHKRRRNPEKKVLLCC